MAVERSEALVLRGVDFSQTSRIVTLLSPTRGRIACMAKGVRRPRSALAGALDTFNRLEIVYYWKDSRSVQQLAECSLVDGFAGIKSDLDKSTYAAFPLEFAYRVAHENDPSSELYDTIKDGLEGLAQWSGDVRLYTCWLMLRLLAVAGFEPALRHCCQCSKEMTVAPGFSYDGGATCGACGYDRKLSPKGYDALVALGEAEGEPPPISGGAEIFAMLRGYVSHHVETDFRSIRVIEQMFGMEESVPSSIPK